MVNNASGSEANGSFDFTRLPREIRDRIYEELLLTDLIDYGLTTWSLEPSILRTSKQIHAEAGIFLYQSNNWILCSIDEILRDILAKQVKLSYPTSINAFPGPVALQMSIFEEGFKSGTSTCLLTARDAHLFCRLLSCELKPRFYVMILAFSETLKFKPFVLETLLDAFQDIRGMKTVVITKVFDRATNSV